MVAFTYSRTGSVGSVQNLARQAEQAASTSESVDDLAQAQSLVTQGQRQLNMLSTAQTISREESSSLQAEFDSAQNRLSSRRSEIQTVSSSEIVEAANQTADREFRRQREERPFSYTSEDFTAKTSEAAEEAARENARAQAAISFGSSNYNVNHYDTNVRLLPNGQYSAYSVAHGFGQSEDLPNVPVSDDEDRRIVRPLVSDEDGGFTITPTLVDPAPVEVPLPEIAVEDRPTTSDTPSDEPVAVDVKYDTNPLHKYSTYTYGISLHYMTLKDYNAFVTGRVKYSPKENRVIIASGGRRNATLVRNKNFNLDMYIGDFKMVTVIGQNAKTRGTNAVTIEFTIYEPISATLIERFVALARENNIQSWVEMPLVLQIDFFVQNENGTYGETPIEGLTKFFCVKIIDLKLAITNKGSEYRCRAQPVNHTAFNATAVNVPANFEITAKTIGEFFKASTNTDYVSIPDGGKARDELATQTANSGNKQPKGYAALSIADALNQFQRSLAKPAQGKRFQETADEYFFVIDQEIADSKIFIPDKHNLSQSAIQNDVTNQVQKDNNDSSRGVIPINAGANLVEVMNNIIRSSEFYRKNVKEDKNSESDPQKNRPIDIHKITSKIEYADEWDSTRKQYRKKITYFIKKYQYHNHTYPNAPRSLPKTVSKYYHYIYTGQNQDVRDLRLDFNTLWFQALTSFESRFEKDNLNITDDPLSYSEGLDLSGQRPTAAAKAKKDDNNVFPYRTFSTSVNQSNQQLSDGSKKSVQAVDLWNSIFNNPGGDMVTLTLEIAGDPDYIKQDDIWFPTPASGTTEASGIPTDSGQVYIYLQFKIPDDINLETGLYNIDTQNSAFSGIYGISTVENSLRDGAFIQKLTCYRLFGQEAGMREYYRSLKKEGERESSDRLGLAESTDDYENELNQVALRAYEDNQRQAPLTEPPDPDEQPTNTAFTNYREWETSDAVNTDDFPGA